MQRTKALRLAATGLLLILPSSSLLAKGCIKGAVVGGVAGHYVGRGHAVAGAAVGCYVGHHRAAVQARQQREAAAQTHTQQQPHR
jgi:uncharacterized protein YcfJ